VRQRGKTYPISPGHANPFDANFDNPAAVAGSWETRLASFRRVRDEIRHYFREGCLSIHATVDLVRLHGWHARS
jgi:hypothetical protein